MDYSEGVYGLVRAFRAAGARRVLMALQSVNDAKAKDFMLSFYERWLNANLSDPAKALRETQLSFIREKENPNVWAPFVLVETRQ
jgi:CHAT domain-containing protein